MASEERGTEAWAIPVVVAGVILLLGSIYLIRLGRKPEAPMTYDSYEPRAFDAVQWERTKGLALGGRLNYAEDLLANHLRAGMSQDELLLLLGPPDVDPYFKPGEWVYCLGLQRGIPVDNEWLYLNFDGEGLLSQWGLTRD